MKKTKSEGSREEALAKFLGCGEDEPRETPWGHHGMKVFALNGEEYAVGTDEEATEAAKQDIEELLWAFNPSFLASMTGLDEEVFKALQPQCEGANKAILSIVKGTCGLEDFVEEALKADGRGHFLSGYDGEENEEGEYFIYRVN